MSLRLCRCCCWRAASAERGRLLLSPHAEAVPTQAKDVRQKQGPGGASPHAPSGAGIGVLSQPANASPARREDRPALHQAAREGDIARVRALVAAADDLDALDTRGLAALHYAARRGHADVCVLLLSSGAHAGLLSRPPGGTPSTALHMAALRGFTQVARLLVRFGCSADVRDGANVTALGAAACAGLADVVYELLRCGADPNARFRDDWTPLHVAMRRNYTEIARGLLAHGADTSLRARGGWLPLHCACASGALGALRALASWEQQRNGAFDALQPALVGPRDRGLLPLHLACRSGALDVVRLLWDAGAAAHVNARDRLYWTPLHYAAEGGHAACARFLVANGADVNASDDEGLTPLHKASENGHAAVAELLLDRAGAAADPLFRGHFTPLHFAAQNGHLPIVRALLAAGASPAAGAKVQYTPLHAAVRFEHPDVVRELAAHV
eukprot:gnl/Chilomastix_cuspidata/3279.p1 GENE.gnl/Chilomastix_cuspidata/3279~~gnl/Chilomastix_cuspidata/3279.p1  ORF type:complete len:444 (+),score=147.56 gnl/Chilomastix_cuspidata/3279:835-2166(+)